MPSAKNITKKGLLWIERYTRIDMRYIARGSFWHFFEQAGAALLSLLTLTAFANFAPREVYGEYKYILSFVGIVSILSLPGVKEALVRSIAKKKEGAYTRAFQARLFGSLLGSLVLLIGGGWYFINGNMVLGLAFSLTALFFPFRFASEVFGAFWRGRKRFDMKAFCELGLVTSTSLVLILTLYLTNNIVILVIANVASFAFFRFLLYLFTRTRVENSQNDQNLVSFGKHLSVIQAFGTVAGHIDKIILWQFLGPVQVAVYSFALEPSKKARGLIPIKALALPKLSEHGVSGKGRKKSLLKKFLLLFLFTIPAAGILIMIAPFAYEIVFPQYSDSVMYFQALSILIALTPFAVLASSLVAEMKTRYLYITRTVTPTLKIVLLVLLTFMWGIWGAVIAILISEILQHILVLYFFWKM